MSPENSELEVRLLSLLQAVRDGRDETSRRELNELLRREPAARAVLARLLVDEQALISQLRDASIVAILEPQSATVAIASFPTNVSRGSRAWMPAALAAAAVVIASLLVWLVRRPDYVEVPAEVVSVATNSAPQVAVVTQTVNARWNGRSFLANDRVPPGRLSLSAGLVRLQFLSGATVVIQGPAELELKSEREAEVHAGLVTATVPPVAEGFTLVAAGWRAVDRGTVFGVDARTPDHPEVMVLEGRVDLHRGASGVPERSLTTGESVRLSAQGGIETATAGARFPREGDIIERAAEEERGQFIDWRQRSAELARDHSLVLYYDFESADRERGIIRNLAPDARPENDGALIGGEWAEGRWPGKGAVAFQRVGDLIRVLLGTNLTAATFVASVRFEPVSPLTQTILLSPQVGPGQIFWMLSGRNRVGPRDGLVFIKSPEAGKHLRLASGRALTTQERGRWMQLAVVHDPVAKCVRHFLNGELIKELALDDPSSLDLNQIVIGNWGFTSEPRNFVGRMDELAIFNRALSDAEIRNLEITP